MKVPTLHDKFFFRVQKHPKKIVIFIQGTYLDKNFKNLKILPGTYLDKIYYKIFFSRYLPDNFFRTLLDADAYGREKKINHINITGNFEEGEMIRCQNRILIKLKI